MRFKTFVEQWQGIVLMLVGCVSAIWLAATHQLDLYIHPRYIIFTVIVAAIGLVLAVLSLQQKSLGHHEHKTTTLLQTIGLTLGLTSLLFVIAGMLAITPTTLSNVTAEQRGMNSGIKASDAPISNAVPLFAGGDYTNFTVKEWASLITQTNNPTFFAGKAANVTGFVSPDPDDPQNVFFVSRFVVTCCAVDARPIGVPVHLPDWQSTYKTDEWLTVKGTFTSNPSRKSTQVVTLEPDTITRTTQPENPYDY